MRKNTVLTIGIIFCSLFISFFCRYAFATNATVTRTYEIQFHSINLHKKLNYTRLKEMGFTKVIYRVFQDTKRNGGLYFTNTQFRTLSPSLERLIAEFDSSNLNSSLDLCAWMIGRKFNWIKNTLLFDYQYKGGYRQMVPRLDIFNPGAIHKIIAVYKELAAKRIGYILIQDDFVLRHNEGFSNWGKAQFSKTTKVPAREKLMMATDTPYNINWKRVKINRLNKVLKLIVENCKKVNPTIKVGMNIYYETPIRVKEAEAWYSHNLMEILGTGIDYIYLMSYHRQIKKEMKLSETSNRLLFMQIVEKAYEVCKEKLVVKIQIRDWKTGLRIPASEIKSYLSLIPPQVERICFTPVKVTDFDYLEELIGSGIRDKAAARGPSNKSFAELFKKRPPGGPPEAN